MAVLSVALGVELGALPEDLEPVAVLGPLSSAKVEWKRLTEPAAGPGVIGKRAGRPACFNCS